MKKTKDYSKGIIYRVFSKSAELQGFGSTSETLEIRKGRYKSDYKGWLKGNKNVSNYSIFKVMEHSDWDIEKIEDYPCESKTELELREGWYHRNFECVNKNVAGRTKKEYTAKRLKPINCDLCGVQTSKLHLLRHQKSKRCKELSAMYFL